jgi:hypothetical protein
LNAWNGWGVPPDVLAVIRAIYDDPKGKVAGTKTWFRVARRVWQGGVLGPAMFLVALEMCLGGVCFVSRKSRPLPKDLRGRQGKN